MDLDGFHERTLYRPCPGLAMKKRRRTLEIFSLSFLDVMACGLGAAVMLVLVSHFNKNQTPAAKEQVENQLELVLSEEARLQGLERELAEKRQGVVNSEVLLQRLKQALANAKRGVGATNQELEKLQEEMDGLALVQTSLKNSAAVKPSSATKRDQDEVGGIPVDSDYIIFIIDSSGSMQTIWSRVLQEVTHILDIHPQVKGFQVMNDNGIHALSGYEGKWIPDTPGRRQSVIKLLKSWNRASNSSPVEGLEAALQKYARKGLSLSIYIIGDDYSGSSYDPVITTINRLNRDGSGKRLAKIHAIGFISAHGSARFPVLMREVARQNGGTFLGLQR